jgi:hypothetical protein
VHCRHCSTTAESCDPTGGAQEFLLLFVLVDIVFKVLLLKGVLLIILTMGFVNKSGNHECGMGACSRSERVQQMGSS